MVRKFNKRNVDSRLRISPKVIIFAISLIALAALVFGGYYVYNIWFNLQNTPEAIGKRVDNVYKKLDEVSSNGTPDDSQKYLDDELKKAASKEELAQIYIMKAAAADTAGSTDKAKTLEYAYKAESIYSSYKSALIIANTEKSKNNNATALKYYKLCVERAPKVDSEDWTAADTNYYNKIIAELEKGSK